MTDVIIAQTDLHGFLGLIGPEDRERLFAQGRTLAAARGAVLIYEGEPGDRIMILLAGRVKVTRTSVGGHEILLSICDPGDLLGELAFIDGESQAATVTALEPVEVLLMSASAFRTQTRRTPDIALAVLKVLAKRFREATLWRSQLSGSDTTGRLAACLTQLAERYGQQREWGVEIALPLSQEELSAWTAASRAGVAKALQTLRELGWIETQRRRMLLRNPEAVKARAA